MPESADAVTPSRHSRPPTIYQVAEVAGVSPATVSRVFNGVPVSQKYTDAVHAAARQLGFRPNSAARALRTRTTEVLALIIADIDNPFFTKLARGVEDVARSAGYSVVLCNSDEDESREDTYLGIAAAQHMAGVIITPASERTDISSWVELGKPVVSVDRVLTTADVDCVMIDNRERARTATRTLFERGYRRVACIAGPKGAYTADERVAGWRDIVHEFGSPDHESDALLFRDVAKESGGEAAMRRLLELPEPPDAVFIGNSVMGIGALIALEEAGLGPDAMRLFVFGDLTFAGVLQPTSLDVMRLPARKMGEVAARVLLDRIGGDQQPPRTILVRD